MIEILRLTRPTDRLTAEVFEDLFGRELGRLAVVRPVHVAAWCRAVLGPPAAEWAPDRAARRFAAATTRAHFLCPNWQSIVLAPLLLSLRNRSRARVRLLLIAHAPGCYAVEWALVRPLLRPGDLIIAPSDSARAAVEYLCADVAPWIRVVPHPMAPLPALPQRRDRDRLVSLGRIVPGKLLHRQIEAMDVLRARGRRLPAMDIAGAVEEPGGVGPRAYARALTEKIRRLDLENHVRLVGAIRGAPAKAHFLSGARALVNLSVTVEESFGKAPVEALGLGVPVVGTRWDGLPATIGAGGVLVPVQTLADGSVDVSPHAIADAFERLIDRPPSRRACAAEAAKFAPAVVLPRYHAVLDEALRATERHAGHEAVIARADDPAAPRAGLLSAVPPLTRLSWGELFAHHLDTCRAARASWEGRPPSVRPPGVRLRALVLASTRRPLEQFLAGRPASLQIDTRLPSSSGGDAVSPEPEFLERIALRAESSCRDGDFAGAVRICLSILDVTLDTEGTAGTLRQLARIARKWQRPSIALPRLTQWLDRFPDSPDSGPVWLDRAVNALLSADADLDDARRAIDRARALLGDRPVIEKTAMLLAVRAACAA